MHLFKVAAMAAALMLVSVATAFAQDVAAVVLAEPTLVKQILEIAVPTLITAVGGVLLVIINSLAGYVKDRFGIEIEAKHREALHSALLTGMRLALVRLGWVPGSDIPKQALTIAADYAKQSVPEAIRVLRAEGSLIRLAESKAPVATAEVAASGPEPVKVAA